MLQTAMARLGFDRTLANCTRVTAKNLVKRLMYITSISPDKGYFLSKMLYLSLHNPNFGDGRAQPPPEAYFFFFRLSAHANVAHMHGGDRI